MANPNKRKGDRAEIAVKNYLQSIGLEAKRTRSGWNDDLGDIIATTPHGLLCVQVKDVAQPKWGEWFEQLAEQVKTLKDNTPKPVIGGVIVWKQRGKSDPGQWRVVCQLQFLPQLLNPT